MDLRPPLSIAEELMHRYERSAETGESAADAILKYFNPCGAATWYISEGMPLNENGEPCALDDAKDWHFFGWCDLGMPGCAELGYVLLSQLEEIKLPFGLGIERDLYFDAKPLNDLKEAA